MGVYFKDGTSLQDMKKQANKNVGKKVKFVRKKLKLTQKEFSKAYDIKGGNSAVSKIENAKRSITADLLPVLAEDGKTTVEQFYREDAVILTNVMYDCLTKMNIESNHVEPMMQYIGDLTDDAIENIGAAKLFDLIFAILRTTAQKGNTKGILMDEISVIEYDDYEYNKSSRYVNYIMEMAIYNKKKN